MCTMHMRYVCMYVCMYISLCICIMYIFSVRNNDYHYINTIYV